MDYIKNKVNDLEDKYRDYRFYIFLKQLINQVSGSVLSDSGAMIAYYFLLSFFPFLIFLISVLSYTPLSDSNVLLSIASIMPEDVAQIFTTFFTELIGSRSEAILSTSILITIYSSSKGISSLIRAVNRAYNVKDNRSFIHMTILSIVLTLGLALLIVLILVSIVFGKIIIDDILVFLHLESWFSEVNMLVRLLIPSVSMYIVLSLMYKYGPNKKVSLRSTIPGALVATISTMVMSIGFAFYVNNFGKYNLTYGSLGGVIVLLIWISLLGSLIVLGAEINGSLLAIKAREAESDNN